MYLFVKPLGSKTIDNTGKNSLNVMNNANIHSVRNHYFSKQLIVFRIYDLEIEIR